MVDQAEITETRKSGSTELLSQHHPPYVERGTGEIDDEGKLECGGLQIRTCRREMDISIPATGAQ